MFDEFSAQPKAERPSRDGSWGLVIVTMLFIAYGVWSWYQIDDLQKLRIEVRDLRSEVDSHRVELSKLQIRLDDVDGE